MPQGKPAGVACVQLDQDLRCRLFGQPERPAFCASLRPHVTMCGNNREQALGLLARLETDTDPRLSVVSDLPPSGLTAARLR